MDNFFQISSFFIPQNKIDALLGVPGASVAAGILKLKDASLALAADPNGITRGDCSSLLAEVASYFDRAAAAVS